MAKHLEQKARPDPYVFIDGMTMLSIMFAATSYRYFVFWQKNVFYSY